jgi:hypothetical protein
MIYSALAVLSEHPVGNLARRQEPPQKSVSLVYLYTIYVSLCTGRLSGALCQSSRIHIRAAVTREYVYATDERGTKTPPANAHVRDVYGHTIL